MNVFTRWVLAVSKCLGLIAIITLLLVPAEPALAEQSSLRLSQAMQRTLEQHPALQVFPLRQTQLEANKKTANLKPAYVVGAEVENVAGTGELSGVKSLETKVSLSSVWELGGKRQARVDLVEENSSVVSVERKIKSLDLLGSVTRLFIDVLNRQERVELAKESLSLARDTLAEVNKRVRAAVAPSADKGRAEAAVQQAELTLLAEQQQLDTEKMALANLWGSYRPDFDTVAGSLYNFGEARPFDVLFEQVKLNPDIELFAAQTRVRDAEIRLARTQQTANLSWSVGIRRDEGLNDSALVAGISMPLFSEQRAQGDIEAALAARNQVSYRRDEKILALHTQLYRAYSGREQAITTTKKLHEQIIPNLEKSLAQTKQGYQRGLYSYLDYLTARQDLLKAKRALIEAAAAALHDQAEIEQLTAEPLTQLAQ